MKNSIDKSCNCLYNLNQELNNKLLSREVEGLARWSPATCERQGAKSCSESWEM